VVEGEEPTPIRDFKSLRLQVGDVLVVPEGYPKVMRVFRSTPVRRFVIALNWHYIFRHLPDNEDYRSYAVEGAIVVAPFVGGFVSWTMGLPVHQVDFSVDPALYFQPERKEPRIAYMGRKAVNVDALRRTLRSRRPEFVEAIEWKGLDGLSRAEYAAEVRRASIFLNLSSTEGIGISMIEAMGAGCLVAGYDGVGTRGIVIGGGPERNAVLVQCGDYASLAYVLDPILTGLLGGSLAPWRKIVEAGRATAARHTPESEERSVLEFWRRMLAQEARKP
jgi:glycosyltransferase involved in cell wall biosynthesis